MSELRSFLEQMSSENPGSSAGSAAGVTAAMGAALAAKTARLSNQSVAAAAARAQSAVELCTGRWPKPMPRRSVRCCPQSATPTDP